MNSPVGAAAWGLNPKAWGPLNGAASALVTVSPTEQVVCAILITRHVHHEAANQTDGEEGGEILRPELLPPLLGWHFPLKGLFTIQNKWVAARGSWLSTGIVATAACRRQEIGKCISVPRDFTPCCSFSLLSHCIFPSISSLYYLSVLLSQQLRSHASYLTLTTLIC